MRVFKKNLFVLVLFDILIPSRRSFWGKELCYFAWWLLLPPHIRELPDLTSKIKKLAFASYLFPFYSLITYRIQHSSMQDGNAIERPHSVAVDVPDGLQQPHHTRTFSTGSNSGFIDPFSEPSQYYGPATDIARASTRSKIGRTRTLSAVENRFNRPMVHEDDAFSKVHLQRRGSNDTLVNRRFFISDIDETLRDLLKNEDSDSNCQITIEDTGPKVLRVGTANSNGYRQTDIRGTYMLSNLLQELTIAKRFGRNQMVLDEARLNENPVKRLRRLISHSFWKNLTRQVGSGNVAEIAQDTKIDTPDGRIPRIYVPHDDPEQYEFYLEIARKNEAVGGARLDVRYLNEVIDPEYVKSINGTPGLLALATHKVPDGQGGITLEGYPYVVPGGRFNELYGWDSYMMALGLLKDGMLDLARGMVENFIYEIRHYGMILNANRSYYLGRSQPPFLTDFGIMVYEAMVEHAHQNEEDTEKSLQDAEYFLRRTFCAAICEYKTVWCCEPRLDKTTGLSCYHPQGVGIPPETESTHFTTLLTPYAKKHGVSIEEFYELYNNHTIVEPELDEYFLHDRAVRESGHDTSYRLEGICASLATVDLNALLYKYEVDIAKIIKEHFNDELVTENSVEHSAEWTKRAELRKERMDKYLWNEEEGIYFDYNLKLKKQHRYESVTTFWPMWAGCSSQEQAQLMVDKSLSKFEEFGGLVAGTLASRGRVGLERPSRQWDYPYGWAPQQILAWVGLDKYGFRGHTKRLCYRWLYLMTKAFVDYNGIVVEKYDVTTGTSPHKVDAEYGNQGADFKGVATEGFGWVNASFILGLTYLDVQGIRAIGAVTSPDVFFRKLKPWERASYGLRPCNEIVKSN
ncbi:GQ67_05209T0 [Komagataella phaffii]|nr:GQ67_05209T0 [Komagataella phaffii]AOA70049.1 GQ68_05191T0 [Komagataella phaffii GS115]